ncbi:MAG: FkbM family methyltransferase [Ignavibacteria bacterium]
MIKEKDLLAKISDKEEVGKIYPYIETFKEDQINFKYWIGHKVFELWYNAKSWYNSPIIDGYKRLIQQGDRVLNIGSGYGFTNCVIRNLIGSNGILVGVEAFPENCQIADSHNGLNNYDNCFIINAAASYDNNKCIIWNRNNSAVTYRYTNDPDDTLLVNSIRCDDLIQEYGIFDVLAININGYETLALSGCTKILKSKPKLIVKLDEGFLKHNLSSYEDLFSLIKADEYEGEMLLTDVRKFEEFSIEKLLESRASAILYLSPKSKKSAGKYEIANSVINNVEGFLENVAVNGIASDAIKKTGQYFDSTERMWIRYFLNKPFSEKKRVGNVSMLHLGRCGSSVLGFILNQHPKIHWDSEVFHFIYDKELEELKMTSDPINLLKIKMSWPLKEFYGFETKFIEEEHLRKELVNLSLEDYLLTLEDLGYEYFIILKRKNYLRQILSLIIANKTKLFHSDTDIKKAEKVYIDYNSIWFGKMNRPLLDIFQYFDHSYERVESLLSTKKLLKLTYEDDILTNPIIAYNKVCDFLNIEYGKPSIVFKRTNPFSLEETIENLDALKELLSNSKYEWMLND